MKKNGFISKQVQKLIAPVVQNLLIITHGILVDLASCESYDDAQQLLDKIITYDDYEKYVLDKLKGVEDNG